MSKKKKHTASNKNAWVTFYKQLTSEYRLLTKLWIFLSELAHFANKHQCRRYIWQSTKHMQQISENAYNYYVKLLSGLIGVYSASWVNN